MKPITPLYHVGEIVNVLVFGKVRGHGRIHTITFHSEQSSIVEPGTPIYWIEGFATGKVASQLQAIR